jgi:photosystem II stability/assembly factor-like uncharacterized protein
MKGTGLAISTALLLGAHFAAADAIRWVPIGPPPPVDRVRILAIGPPSATGLIYVSTISGLRKTEDAGATWTTVNVAAELEAVVSMAVDPAAPSTVYASTQAPLPVYPFTGGLYKTTDGGTTWTRITTLPSATVYALAVIAQPAPRVFAATHQGIYCSPDGGARWVLVGAAGRPVEAITFSADHPLVAYAFSDEIVFRSGDAGDSWQAVKSDFLITPSSLAIDPADPSIVLVVGTRFGPQPGGVPPLWLKTTDGGVTWENFGVPEAATSSFAYVSDGTLFAAAYPIGGTWGVFRSTDRGGSWEAASDGLGTEAVVALASSGTTIYASSASAVFRALSGSACTADAVKLCLSEGRFRVTVSWTASTIGQSGQGFSMPLTADSGAFWFFQPSNIELVIKVLDGRVINGHFWVFYGALSNVGYTITITDTETGAQKTYTNPEGTLASHADTEAF